MDSSTHWRKSSRSGSGNACLEIRNDLHALRDSKNPDGPYLYTANLHVLIAMVRH